MDRNTRLRLFVERFVSYPCSGSFDEARTLLNETLNAIEDEHSGVPYEPSNWKSDGRMYPPQDDRERASENQRVRCFDTRGHLVEFGYNGAVRIRPLKDGLPPLLDKPGADGQLIEDLYTDESDGKTTSGSD
jgi:hypothetical protein